MIQEDGADHAMIRCGTLLVNDLDSSIALYRDALEQVVVESGTLDAELVNSWGAPRLLNAPTCLLRPKSQAQSFIRLVQSPDIVAPVAHATTFGWCAFEINVSDVFELAKKLEATGFTVIGAPKRMDKIANVIPMQVVGPDQEVLFLNQVLESDSHTDLPIAQCTVDRIFIAVLAATDRQATVSSYSSQLKCQEAGTHELRYSLINRAFGFDPETTHKLTLVQDGRIPFLEVDQYPVATQPRPSNEGNLPHGNAMVSIVVNDLDALRLNNRICAEPVRAEGLLYGGCRSLVIRGDDGEHLELIEVPKHT